MTPDLAVLVDLWTVLFVSIGCFFFLAGTVGLLRFPDLFCRLHALTKADTLGLGFIVVGLLPRTVAWGDRMQLLVIWLLALAAAATVCHLLAGRSLRAGIAPYRKDAPPPSGPAPGPP